MKSIKESREEVAAKRLEEVDEFRALIAELTASFEEKTEALKEEIDVLSTTGAPSALTVTWLQGDQKMKIGPLPAGQDFYRALDSVPRSVRAQSTNKQEIQNKTRELFDLGRKYRAQRAIYAKEIRRREQSASKLIGGQSGKTLVSMQDPG